MNASARLTGVYNVKITSEIPGTIRYTTDDNEPTEASEAYTDVFQVPENTTVKAILYPSDTERFAPSDVSEILLPVPSPMEIPLGTRLSDGTIFYDRGSEYGNYTIFNGSLMRISAGIDDGSADSENWRFLIADLDNTSSVKWGLYETLGTSQEMGAGIENTEKMIESTGSMEGYMANYVLTKRAKTNTKWFIPSFLEMKQITNNGNVPNIVRVSYATSSESGENSIYVWHAQDQTQASAGDKAGLHTIRLIRRI